MGPASHAPTAALRHPRMRPGGPLAVRGQRSCSARESGTPPRVVPASNSCYQLLLPSEIAGVPPSPDEPPGVERTRIVVARTAIPRQRERSWGAERARKSPYRASSACTLCANRRVDAAVSRGLGRAAGSTHQRHARPAHAARSDCCSQPKAGVRAGLGRRREQGALERHQIAVSAYADRQGRPQLGKQRRRAAARFFALLASAASGSQIESGGMATSQKSGVGLAQWVGARRFGGAARMLAPKLVDRRYLSVGFGGYSRVVRVGSRSAGWFRRWRLCRAGAASRCRWRIAVRCRGTVRWLRIGRVRARGSTTPPGFVG
jgi:hypothetical protein